MSYLEKGRVEIVCGDITEGWKCEILNISYARIVTHRTFV